MDGVWRGRKPLEGLNRRHLSPSLAAAATAAVRPSVRSPGWLAHYTGALWRSIALAIAGPFYHILPIPTRMYVRWVHVYPHTVGRWAERHQRGGGVSGQKSNAQKSMPSLSLMQKGRKRPVCSTQRWRLLGSENQANKAFFSKQPHEKCTKTSY